MVLQNRVTPLVLVLIGVLLFTAACGPKDEHALDDSARNQRQAEAPEVYTQTELRARFGERNSGDNCASDVLCEAPLRCIQGECAYPPAMTGTVTEAMPHLRIHTQNSVAEYHVELALNPAEQARGLMHREHMHPEFGMLFIFPDEETRSFWMKNTFIPLDMIFIRADGVIDSILPQVPPQTLNSRTSVGKVRYVLELVAGEAARAGMRPGDRVEFLQIANDLAP